jgi:hypothetical protein
MFFFAVTTPPVELANLEYSSASELDEGDEKQSERPGESAHN